jgi:hypothetical protein
LITVVLAGFIHVDAKAAGTQNGEGKIGRICFDGFLIFQAENAEIDGALGDANLHDAIIEIQEGKPVWPERRITAEPTGVQPCAWSVQSLSPVVMGRFTTADTQSSVPPGLKETSPFV